MQLAHVSAADLLVQGAVLQEHQAGSNMLLMRTVIFVVSHWVTLVTDLQFVTAATA